MKPIIEELTNRGCNMEETMARFLDNEDFYEECLVEMLGDAEFENLGKAIESNNVKDGFASAHTLKGVIANMGITPMYETVCRIVEPFRAGNEDGVAEAYKELLEEREEYRELIAKLC